MRLVAIAAAVAFAATTTRAQTPLATTITTLLADPAVSHAHWGIQVTTLDGTPIYSLDEAKLFHPASTVKLFTTAAAMQMLGPKRTFDTKVVGKLNAFGTITGDLTLAGGGDPSFGTDDIPYVLHKPASKNPLHDLTELADALVAKGVRHIKGNIVGGDYRFAYEPYPIGWNVDDTPYAYAAPVSALSIADNSLRLTIAPPADLKSAKLSDFTKLEQNGIPYYTLDSHLGITDFKYPTNVDLTRTPGSHTVRIFGQMQVNAPPDVEHLAIDDPAEYAAQLFRKLLVDRGITVEGKATTLHELPTYGNVRANAEPGDCDVMTVNGSGCPVSCMVYWPDGDVLATHTSQPLTAEITYTLKTSANLHAEILLRHLGMLDGCTPSYSQYGISLTRAYLLHIGLDPTDFVFYDGSGLSTKDLVTPRATAKLLAYAATQPWFSQWRAALPIGGVDGTLSDRFKEPPLKGHVFAKTGTLGESRALAGYLDAASGQTLIFAIYVDNHTPGSSADRVVMDKIVAAIAAAD